MTLAFRCVQTSVAYRTSTVMADKLEDVCSKDDTFFGKRVTAEDGSLWLSNESNNLFLPLVHPEKKTEMFEEVHYTCTNVPVYARSTPELSNTCEVFVKAGHKISALPVLDQPGWLIEADSKLYYPMNHPTTGDPLFKASKTTGAETTGASGDVEQGAKLPTLVIADDPTCEQVATCVSCCIPLVGCVTFCISCVNFKEGSEKRKWGTIACGVSVASAILSAIILRFGLWDNLFPASPCVTDTYDYSGYSSYYSYYR